MMAANFGHSNVVGESMVSCSYHRLACLPCPQTLLSEKALSQILGSVKALSQILGSVKALSQILGSVKALFPGTGFCESLVPRYWVL